MNNFKLIPCPYLSLKHLVANYIYKHYSKSGWSCCCHKLYNIRCNNNANSAEHNNPGRLLYDKKLIPKELAECIDQYGKKPYGRGFCKPSVISREMAEFCNVSSNTCLSRIKIAKQICEYIKKNNLQNPHKKREIFPDETLQNLLRVPKQKQLSYFNLQCFLNAHIRSYKDICKLCKNPYCKTLKFKAFEH